MLTLALVAALWWQATRPIGAGAPASDAYIEARALIDNADPAQHARAETRLRDALAETPNHSASWSALATLMCQRALAPADKYPEAQRAAARALAIDADNVEAHLRLAEIAIAWERDWQRAESHLAAALDAAPGDAMVHHARASWHYLRGELARGEAAMLEGLAIDPLATVLHTDLVWYYTVSGEYQKALDQCALLARLDGAAASTTCALQPTLLMGRVGEAARIAATALDAAGVDVPEGPPASVLQAFWRRSLATVSQAARQTYVDPVLLARLHALLGEPAETLALLEEAVASRSPFAPYVHLFPEFRALHGRPEFVALMAQIGVPGRQVTQLREEADLRRSSSLAR